MRSEGCWPLGGSLPTSLSIPLGVFPYITPPFTINVPVILASFLESPIQLPTIVSLDYLTLLIELLGLVMSLRQQKTS